MRLALRPLGFAIGPLFGWQTGSLLVVVALSVGGIGYVLGPHVGWAVVRNVRQVARAAAPLDLAAIAELATVTVTRLLPAGTGRLVFAVPKQAPAAAPS